MALRVGKKRTTITNYLRLLRLPDTVQKALKDGKISVGHAKVLLGVEDTALQDRLCDSIIRNDWSVRRLEQKLQSLSRKESPVPEAEDLPEVYYALAERVGRHFDGNVAVRRDAKGGGTITIRFGSQSQVEAFLEDLNR